jgi:serine/threonine-protein kinase RsbT
MAADSGPALPGDIHIPIRVDGDIVTARQQGRALAEKVGFNGSDLTRVATAISELGRNILRYAGSGIILLRQAHAVGKHGIVIVAHDEGPGIADVALAMQDGYSTSNSLGLGLPGARRLMDEFEIASVVGRGTTVTAKKWLVNP